MQQPDFWTGKASEGLETVVSWLISLDFEPPKPSPLLRHLNPSLLPWSMPLMLHPRWNLRLIESCFTASARQDGLRPGHLVEVNGLTSPSGQLLNGQRGLVCEYVEATGRWQVRIGLGLRSEKMPKRGSKE